MMNDNITAQLNSNHPFCRFDSNSRAIHYNRAFEHWFVRCFGADECSAEAIDVVLSSDDRMKQTHHDGGRMALAGMYHVQHHAAQFMDFHYMPMGSVDGIVTGYWLLVMERHDVAALLADERNRIARDLHDELGTGLSRISMLGTVPSAEAQDPGMALQKAVALSGALQQQIGEIIWSMQPECDSLHNLVSYLRYHLSGYSALGGCRFEVATDPSLPDLTLSGQLRRSIFLIVKEAATNILKHAGATSALLRLSIQEKTLVIVLDDNGKGFDTSTQHAFCYGLKNMQKRVEDIGGTLKVTSSPGAGTRVEVRV